MREGLWFTICLIFDAANRISRYLVNTGRYLDATLLSYTKMQSHKAGSRSRPTVTLIGT